MSEREWHCICGAGGDAELHSLMCVNDEPCMCGTPFTCMADEHDYAVAALSQPLPAEQRPAGTPTTPSTDHEPTRAQEETT